MACWASAAAALAAPRNERRPRAPARERCGGVAGAPTTGGATGIGWSPGAGGSVTRIGPVGAAVVGASSVFAAFDALSPFA